MASGLRVNSASDDPSGYTIGASIDTKIAGLQQSVTNVQTANNLMAVAGAALSNITSVLQRIRSLIVESNSDINSENDLQNIQSEIDQLLLEINKISDGTTFNGLKLFSGQFAQGNLLQSGLFGTTLAQALPETPPFPNLATGQTGTNTLVDGTGNGTPAPFMQVNNLLVGQFVPTFTVWSIVSASNNMHDPDSNTDIGPGVLIQEEAYSIDGASFGPTPLFVDYSAFPTNAGAGQGPFQINAPSDYPNSNPQNPNGIIFNGVTFNNVTAADVGAQAAFLTLLPQNQPQGTALNVNDGGDEGTTIAISLPNLSTQSLGISGISVLAPQVTTILQDGTNTTPIISGQSSSNVMAASYSEIVVDQALQAITETSAQVGAQTVALQQDADGDNVAIVNLQAASSNIRDANIGATVADYTKQQILSDVGYSVLSQIEVSAQQLTVLLLNSFSGIGAAQGAPAPNITGGG